MNQQLTYSRIYRYTMKLALVGLFVFSTLNLFANEFKEATKKSTFLIASNDESVLSGLAKSTFNTIPYKIIDFYPNEIPNHVVYYNIAYFGSRSYNINVYLRYKKESYKMATIIWKRSLETGSEFRALYNHIDQVIAEYIQFVDENGRVNTNDIDAFRKKELVKLANNIKKSTYYTTTYSDVNTKKWDSKNGKVSKSNTLELSKVIESSSDTNGYYIVTEKKNSMLWLTGFFTMGAGFIVSPFIPKYKTTVFSTNSDHVLGTFRMHNPNFKPRKVQKKILKFQNIK